MYFLRPTLSCPERPEKKPKEVAGDRNLQQSLKKLLGASREVPEDL
jgi:hypothetical protein